MIMINKIFFALIGLILTVIVVTQMIDPFAWVIGLVGSVLIAFMITGFTQRIKKKEGSLDWYNLLATAIGSALGIVVGALI